MELARNFEKLVNEEDIEPIDEIQADLQKGLILTYFINQYYVVVNWFNHNPNVISIYKNGKVIYSDKD